MEDKDRYEGQRLYFQLSKIYEWDYWREHIPYIQFLSEWKVKAIPPTGGAIIRYNIKDSNDGWVSIYLDCYNNLGFREHPYWELFPYKGDCFRCDINETDVLLEAIKESFDQQKNKKDKSK